MAAQAQDAGSIDLDLGTVPNLGLGATLNVGLDEGLGGIDIRAALDLNVTLPTGFALAGVTCPGDVDYVVNGSNVSLNADGAGAIAACSFALVNIAAAATASVPAIIQRNEVLLGIEPGFAQMLDRFPDNGTGEDDASPPPSGLGGPMTALAAPFDTSGRMGLLSSGSDNGAPVAFSSSLQQLQRYAKPYMLGNGSAPVRASAQRSFNIWAEGYWAHIESDADYGRSEGHTGVLYVGADYLVSPHVLLGVMLQYDDQKRTFDDAPIRVEDNGWLAGPYAVVRLANDIFFQARAAWGQSDNEIELANVFDDSFDSERWLVKGRLLANMRSGAWLVRPSVSIAYLEDELEAYRSTSGVDVGHRTLLLGQLKFGPEISYRFAAPGGYAVTPSVTLEGIWNFDQSVSGTGFDDLIGDEDLRGRVEAGAVVQNRQGLSFGLAASYDGIGAKDFEAVGGRARVTVPLD